MNGSQSSEKNLFFRQVKILESLSFLFGDGGGAERGWGGGGVEDEWVPFIPTKGYVESSRCSVLFSLLCTEFLGDIPNKGREEEYFLSYRF